MRITLVVLSLFMLSGCGTVKKYWPRSHDPVFVSAWVDTKMTLDRVDCTQGRGAWTATELAAERLYRLSDFREDPQTDNLKGLWAHTQKMNQGGSPTFCELGRKTAQLRLDQTRLAWESR